MLACNGKNRWFRNIEACLDIMSGLWRKGECRVFYKGEPLKITRQRKNQMQSCPLFHSGGYAKVFPENHGKFVISFHEFS